LWQKLSQQSRAGSGSRLQPTLAQRQVKSDRSTSQWDPPAVAEKPAAAMKSTAATATSAAPKKGLMQALNPLKEV